MAELGRWSRPATVWPARSAWLQPAMSSTGLPIRSTGMRRISRSSSSKVISKSDGSSNLMMTALAGQPIAAASFRSTSLACSLTTRMAAWSPTGVTALARRIQTPIVSLTGITANTWYRLKAEITKLTATSAKIDVSLVQLDASGNPTGTPITGSVADTSLWSGGAPADSYFTATTMWPTYKNYSAVAGSCGQHLLPGGDFRWADTVHADHEFGRQWQHHP